jgi:hypothetical protein
MEQVLVPHVKALWMERERERERLFISHTPSFSKQKLRYTKYVGLRSFFAFLARNCVHCIALTKRFPMS